MSRAASALALAREHGATHPINRDVVEARAEVIALTDDKGCDIVFDATGAPAVFPNAHKLLRQLGKMVLAGDSGYPTQQGVAGALLLADPSSAARGCRTRTSGCCPSRLPPRTAPPSPRTIGGPALGRLDRCGAGRSPPSPP